MVITTRASRPAQSSNTSQRSHWQAAPVSRLLPCTTHPPLLTTDEASSFPLP